jgi:hypothetical protein
MTNLLISFLYYLPIAAAGYGLAYSVNEIRNYYATRKEIQ